MSRGIAVLIKRVPQKKHLVEAARCELPRLKIPALTLLVFWLAAIAILPH